MSLVSEFDTKLDLLLSNVNSNRCLPRHTTALTMRRLMTVRSDAQVCPSHQFATEANWEERRVALNHPA